MSFSDSIAARHIAAEKNLSGPELAVLLALCDRKNAQTGALFPSITTLSSDCRFSESTVKRCLLALERKQLLSRQRRGTTSNSYTLHLAPVSTPPQVDRSERPIKQLTLTHEPRSESINKTTAPTTSGQPHYPKVWQHAAARLNRLLKGVAQSTAQKLVDIAAAALHKGTIIRSPERYIAALLHRHQRGQLDTPIPSPKASERRTGPQTPQSLMRLASSALKSKATLEADGFVYVPGYGLV